MALVEPMLNVLLTSNEYLPSVSKKNNDPKYY